MSMLAGAGYTYTGGKAVTQGYVRTATGVAAILFRVAFLFIGRNS